MECEDLKRLRDENGKLMNQVNMACAAQRDYKRQADTYKDDFEAADKALDLCKEQFLRQAMENNVHIKDANDKLDELYRVIKELQPFSWLPNRAVTHENCLFALRQIRFRYITFNKITEMLTYKSEEESQ